MGEKGIRGEMGWTMQRVEKLPFYPLDSHLPLLIQLKLRCKELNFLIQKLQKSLMERMEQNVGMGLKGAWGTGEVGKKGEEWLQKEIESAGLVRMPDGSLVPKDKGTKRE